MTKRTRILLLGLVVGMMASSQAFAAPTGLSAVGALDWHKYSLGNIPAGSTVSENADLGYGGGVLYDISLGQMFSLEPGFLYLQQKWTDTSSSPNTDEGTKEFQIPLVLRYWFSPMFSLGLGGYYAFGTGSITETQSGSSQSIPYATNLTKNDYGLIGSLGFRFPMGQSVSLVADGRYLYGLKDNNDGIYGAGITAKNREIQALVGLSFALGGQGGGGDY